MGLFGCDHKWNKWTRPYKGRKQRKCRKCGRVQLRKVSQFWCNHQYGTRVKRRKNAPKVLKCKKCNKTKPIRKR